MNRENNLAEKHDLRRKTRRQILKFCNNDGRVLRREKPEVNSEILQHDATCNMQLVRSGVGELHMPSRVTSNNRTSVGGPQEMMAPLGI
jgi:hypothetical protein